MTPDKYLPHRYAGASGDFNPIHIDPEFAKAVGLPNNILHGLYMMGLVARANTDAAGGDPRALKRLSVQFRGMGAPEQEIVVTGTVKDGRTADRVVVDTVAAQGDNQVIRNAEAELARALRAARRSPLLEIQPVLTERQELILAPDRRRLPEDGQAGRARKAIAEHAEIEWSPSTVRAELASLEEAGYPHPPSHLRRAGADRLRLPLLRRPAARIGRADRPRPRSSWSSRGCAARSTMRCGRRRPRSPRSPT